jgi:hypothetical protein
MTSAAASPFPDALDFALPGFLRIAWASAQAAEAWAPRLARARAAVFETDWRTVANGERACALVVLDDDRFEIERERWAEHGLCWSELGRDGEWMAPHRIIERATGTAASSRSGFVAQPSAAVEFARAWSNQDCAAVAGMLGLPDCCANTQYRVAEESLVLDPTWPYARRIGDVADNGTITISVERASGDSANPLWRWLGIYAVPHLGCGLDCCRTARIADERRRCCEDVDPEAAGWINEILSWPVEWTALHGIAEVRTPILKFCTATDATAGKYTVRWTGRSYPSEGVQGLGFPYRTPRQRRSRVRA